MKRTANDENGWVSVVLGAPRAPAPTPTVTNTSTLVGECDCDAAPTNNRLLPPVHRNSALPPNGSHELGLAAPPLGVTCGYTVVCRGDFNGQNVEFGRVAGGVTGSL
ncbi:hypothetical protein [Mycobacterium sp. SMC-4]|uniref:hypothetical protein n=1 Tax=Mycobacterium sp. SMC-4 TaxID=2857059 RepID=UPI003D075F01